MLKTVGRSLNLREGEGGLLLALGGFLFLTTAVETLLSAAKNSLFLSVFPARLIPHSMVAGALLTAVAAVSLAGVVGVFRRRALARGLLLLLALSLYGCFVAFRADPRAAFGIYLWASAVQVLVMTHAWDYLGDLLTGRQAKRLLPLIAVGGSLAAVASGMAVGPLTYLVTSEGLLWVSGVLLGASLVLIHLFPEPPASSDATEAAAPDSAVRRFLGRSVQGFRSLAGDRLLRLVAGAVILLVLTATLIDFQWKLVVQARYSREEIAVVYGILEAAIGVGSLILQLVASRVFFPVLGISTAMVLQAGAVGLMAGGVILAGSFWAVAALRFLDESLRESIEEPAVQVSLLPFPTRVKNAAFTTIEGVLRPLAKAGGATIGFVLLARVELLPWMTALGAVAALVLLTRHRRRYLAALEQALSRHLVDVQALGAGRIGLDREVLAVIDRSLGDDDATVVIFALSLLKEFPPGEVGPRVVNLLDHPVPEVRIEAADVLGQVGRRLGRGSLSHLTARLDLETDPAVLASLLEALGLAGEDPDRIRPFVDHDHASVRRAALVALGREDPESITVELESLLRGSPPERTVALQVVGTLGLRRFLPDVTTATLESDVRPAALSALASFGAPALPALDRLLGHPDLPLSVRRTLVTTLATLEDPEARALLLRLVTDDELGPASLTCLRRLRAAGDMDPVERGTLRSLLRAEVERAARYALIGSSLEKGQTGLSLAFVIEEMEELRLRHLHRTLAVLTLAYDADAIARVETNLFDDDPSRRSNALEYLEGTLAGEDANLTVPLAEWSPGEPVDPLVDLTMESRRALDAPLETLEDDDRWWPRSLARFARAGLEGDDTMIPLIEKVMLLKGTDLFRSFPGDELAGIAELTTERHAEAGEVIFEQGDPGDAYYLVVRGGVSILRDDHELAVLESREGFGEMAILDQDTRSATARAVEPTTLLVIDRDSFDQLVERNPAIARGIYRVLTQRLRSTLARIAAS